MPINVLVCIKRVPVTGAKIVLTEDEQTINTKNLGFAMSPHEECAVEEAIRGVTGGGGTTTPPAEKPLFRVPIELAYTQLLERGPDPGGLTSYNERMVGGPSTGQMTEAEMRESIVRSDEFEEKNK